MRTAAASLTGLGLLLIGVGTFAHDAQLLAGVLTVAYGLTVFIGLAMRDSMAALTSVFEAWREWEPKGTDTYLSRQGVDTHPWYGRNEQYTKAAPPLSVKKRSITRREKEVTA